MTRSHAKHQPRQGAGHIEAWLDGASLVSEVPYLKLKAHVILVRDPEIALHPRLRCSADVYRDFGGLSLSDRECFAVLLLDGKHRVTGFHMVSVGCLQGTPVHPREVFKAAIVGNAAALIVVHNHPSGDPTPSADDHAITERLRACGEMLGVPLLDHVIVAADGYWSLMDGGLFRKGEDHGDRDQGLR